jgi:DNA polymerase III gamma/tau subunit
MGALHTKYRPTLFKQVLGQDAAVKALHHAIAKGTSRAFLLTGPTGVGKTTLARIGASKLGAGQADLIEIDGATYTGIDAMRAVASTVGYSPMAGVAKAVIVDEAHRLSKNAWDSLLKVVEEPPSHLSWWFCTTDPSKVPDTIKSRCLTLSLKRVSRNLLLDLLDDVVRREGMKVADGVLDVCADEADGSPRQALVNLAATMGAKDQRAAREILRREQDVEPVRALCQLLTKRGSWPKAVALITGPLAEMDPEAVRINICNYMAVALQSTTTLESSQNLLMILDEFSGKPYSTAERAAPLLLAVGRILTMQEDGR